MVRVRWPAGTFSQPLTAVIVCLVAMSSSLVLAQSLLPGFRLEEALFGRFSLDRTQKIGFMSPLTASTFLLASLALLPMTLSRPVKPAFRELSFWASFGLFAFGLTILLGYVYGFPLFYYREYIPVALPTALAILALGLGDIAAYGPDPWLPRNLLGSATHSRLLRAFLPAALLFGILSDYVEFFLLRGSLINPALLSVSFSLFSTLLMAWLVIWIAKRIGGALDSTQASLRNSEERYRSLFDQSGDGILLTAVDGDVPLVVDANDAALKAHGYSREEIVGQPLCLLNPAITRKTIEAYIDAASSKKPVYAVHRRKDGSKLELESVIRRVRVGTQDVILALQRDITERRQAEEEREKLQAQLVQAQKLESIGRLAGGVAHDFNNLLTVINGYSQLLLTQLGTHDPLRQNLVEINKAGERAAGLTRQLLAYGRKQVLDPRGLNLNSLVEEMRPMLARLVGESVDLRVVRHAGSADVHADPHQLEQVIMNLVVNARDAMPDGGSLLIEMSLVNVAEGAAPPKLDMPPGSYVALAVSDSGTGMDEETRRRIFEPFFTTKDVGKGTGLGLSMVQGIVAQSNGYIDVETERGQGTTFKIYLPALAQAAVAADKPAGPPVVGGIETVLVVEDQAEVRNYAVAVLEVHGYRVFQAENATEALALCEREQERIHLLLTDVVMPKLSGRELAARISKMRPGIEVLFMSGYNDDVITKHGVLQAGAEFIQKPFSPAELALKVRSVLGPRGAAGPVQ